MGMNSLPRRQPPLLKDSLQRREKRLSKVFAFRFGDAFELPGRLIAAINKVPLGASSVSGRATTTVRRQSGVSGDNPS